MSPAMTDLPEAEVWNKLGIASYTKVISPFWRELSLNQLNRSLWLALLGSDQKICNRHFFNKLICHKGALAVLLGETFQQYKVIIISSRISGIQYIFKKKKRAPTNFPWLTSELLSCWMNILLQRYTHRSDFNVQAGLHYHCGFGSQNSQPCS